MLIKVSIDDATGLPEVDFARSQFQVLRRAFAARVADRPLRVPRPYHLFEREAVVVQSWIEGRVLDQMIGDRRVGRRRLEPLFRAAGEWLARYHAAGVVESKTVPVEPLEAEIAEGARRDSALARAAKVLHDRAPLVTARPQVTTHLHCDFKPANVIVNAEGVHSIDFHESERTSTCFDIAHFLNAVALDALKAGRPCLLLSAARLEASFLAGYASVGLAPDEAALRFFLTYDLARYLLQHADSRGLGTRAKSWLLARLLARRVAALERTRFA